jgi:site-specific DNA recombinase
MTRRVQRRRPRNERNNGENLVKRHVRFLMPLAFVAANIIEATVDGTAPAGLTVTRLAKGLPSKWGDQVSAILGG